MKRLIVRVVAIMSCGLVLLVLIDWTLYSIALRVGGGLPVSVWGTYAAWASAIMPPVVVGATLVTWLADRRDREEERIDQELFRVRVEKRFNSAWLVNDSSYAIAIQELRTADKGQVDKSDWVGAGKDVFLCASEEFESVRVLVMRHECEIQMGRPGERLS